MRPRAPRRKRLLVFATGRSSSGDPEFRLREEILSTPMDALSRLGENDFSADSEPGEQVSPSKETRRHGV